jgi:hypothetical protein
MPKKPGVPDVELAKAKHETDDRQTDFDHAIESSVLTPTLGTCRVLSALWNGEPL